VTAPLFSADLTGLLWAVAARLRLEAPDLADELETAIGCYAERWFSCVVPGAPQPQGRARGSVRHRAAVDPISGAPTSRAFVKMRDPATSAAWKQGARWILWGAMPSPRRALEGPVAVHVRAVFPRLKRDQALEGRAWHTHTKGDADNIAKAVLDAANSHAFVDDRQVARLVVEKLIAAPGETPGVGITLAPLDAVAPPAFREGDT